MANDDLAGYCLPDFSKCGPAIDDVVPAAKEAWEHFVSFKWTSADTSGNKAFKQEPFFACWTNVPLCIGMYCIPCCAVAVHARNMEQITGNTFESQCLLCCALQCCSLYPCYYAKKRGEFRAKYGLRGSPLMDCVGGCCFGPCLTCQDAIELQAVSDYSIPHCSEAASSDLKEKLQQKMTPVTPDAKAEPKQEAPVPAPAAAAAAPAKEAPVASAPATTATAPPSSP